MKTRLASALLAALLVASVHAQEPPDMSPAKELAKFEPLIGDWTGTGKMTEGNGVATNWTAETTYQWCLNKHFVQQDFELRFVITLGRKGQLKGGVGHTLIGTMEPFVSFKANYKRRG